MDINSPAFPPRSKPYTWKLCPLSTQYVTKYLASALPYRRALEDGALLPIYADPKILRGTSNNIAYVRSLIGDVGGAATLHSDDTVKMKYHERGWTCFDDNCYSYINFGTRYHEE